MEDMKMTLTKQVARTKACIEYLKTILGRGTQYSKRGSFGYMLLSEGLVDSTADFHNISRSLNRALVKNDSEICDEHFSDDCFDDNRRRTIHDSGWTTRAAFDDFCKGLWKLD